MKLFELSPDGESFWYLNSRGERASVVYELKALERMTGITRDRIEYPVVCSTNGARRVYTRCVRCPRQAGARGSNELRLWQ